MKPISCKPSCGHTAEVIKHRSESATGMELIEQGSVRERGQDTKKESVEGSEEGWRWTRLG